MEYSWLRPVCQGLLSQRTRVNYKSNPILPAPPPPAEDWDLPSKLTLMYCDNKTLQTEHIILGSGWGIN